MDREARDIEIQIYRIASGLGGIGLDDAWTLDVKGRELAGSVIEENIEFAIRTRTSLF